MAMFIRKQYLSRRTFLRGASATIALPFLECMAPAQTPLARTAANPVRRFGFIYAPMGTVMREWMPAQVGAGFEFSPILKPLEPLREYVNVVTGLSYAGENGHSPSAAMFLSSAFPAKGSTIRLNTTVDQAIAQKIGQETAFPSMEFATEDHSMHLGSCAGDFLCSYMSTISWRTPTQPLPMEINPRVIFERMFGGDAATPEARQARLTQNTSILDAVSESINDLRRELGARDQVRLNEYLDNVREIERRVVQGEKQRTERNLVAPPTPIGVPESFDEHVNLLFELQALAFQGDLTRVTSFMLAMELSTRSYPELGVPDGHHPISHNNFVPEQMAKKAKVDTYHVQLFAKFLERLRSTPDGDGNLLDHSLFLYGSGMSNSNIHDHHNLPILLAGKAGGQIKGNRHIKVGIESETRDNALVPKFKEDKPLSNLYVSLLNAAGVETGNFGLGAQKSTGRIEL